MCLDKIKEYFKEYIFGYIFDDIQNCINARANYTVALALASYTDFLGGLINGTLGLQGESKKQFLKALEYFPDYKGEENYYKNFHIKFKDVDYQIKDGDIYSLFRCGLAHEYFIKGDSFVHNNPDGYRDERDVFHREGCISADAGVQVIDINGGKRLRFHTNAYFRDFKQAWEKYYAELMDVNNKNLREKFMNTLERIKVREIKFWYE